jgi:hypothetical protein
MTRMRLQFVNQFRDRNGNVRRYLRRPNCKAALLRGVPGSTELTAPYQAAIRGTTSTQKQRSEVVRMPVFKALHPSELLTRGANAEQAHDPPTLQFPAT